MRGSGPLGEGRTGGTWPWGGLQYPHPGEDLRGAAAALLSQAIRVDTVNPPGGERPLAELLVEVARREGLEARVVDTPSDGSGSERAAAWAVHPGRGTRPAVILLSHLDVVPADRSEWAVDPFEGVVGGGFVVGRGHSTRRASPSCTCSR